MGAAGCGSLPQRGTGLEFSWVSQAGCRHASGAEGRGIWSPGQGAAGFTCSREDQPLPLTSRPWLGRGLLSPAANSCLQPTRTSRAAWSPAPRRAYLSPSTLLEPTRSRPAASQTLPWCCERAAAVPPWGHLNLPQRKRQELAPEGEDCGAPLRCALACGLFLGRDVLLGRAV